MKAPERTSLPPPSAAPKQSSVVGTFFWTLCISMGLCGLLIVNTSSLWNRLVGISYAPEAVGELSISKNNVRYRPSGSVVWVDLTEPKQAVGNGDTVFTDTNGTADLQFKNGTSARIAPNSLVVIQSYDAAKPPRASQGIQNWLSDKLKPRSQVDILEGTVTLGFSKKAEPIDLKIKGRTYRVESQTASGDVKISVSPKTAAGAESQISISSEKALLRVESEGNSTHLEPGKTIAVEAGKPADFEEVIFDPLLPRAGTHIVAAEDAAQAGKGLIHFEWSRKKRETTHLEVTGSGNTAAVLAPDATQAGLPLATGSYRWRLSSASQKRGTAWIDFSTLIVDRPSVRDPENKARYEIRYNEKTKEIPIAVAHPNPDFQIEVELYALQPGNSVPQKMMTKILPGGKAAPFSQLLSPGSYLLRARTAYEKIDSPWSIPVEFTIERQAPPTPVPTPQPTPAPTPKPTQAPARTPASQKPSSVQRGNGNLSGSLIIYP